MYLKSARVRDYRSVVDSGLVEFEEDKTILVGVNEAGKTAFIRAVQQLSAPDDIEKFSALKDYPRSKYTKDIRRGERDVSDIVVVEGIFGLSAADAAAAIAEAPHLKGITEFYYERRLDNTARWNAPGFKLCDTYADIEDDLLRLRKHLETQAGTADVIIELDKLIHNKPGTIPLRDTFRTNLDAWVKTAVPLVDEDDAKEKERLARVRGHLGVWTNSLNARKVLVERLPLFVYYSTYFTVRPRIDLKSLAAREAAGDIDQEYDYGNLLLAQASRFHGRRTLRDGYRHPRPEHAPGR